MSTTLAASPNISATKPLPNHRLFQYHHGNNSSSSKGNPDLMVAQQPTQQPLTAPTAPAHHNMPLGPIGTFNSQGESTSSNGSRRGSKKAPNWAEFYKNGFPKEVIVISDDDDDDDTPEIIVTSECSSPTKSNPKRKRDSLSPASRTKKACPPIEYCPPVHQVFKARDIHVPRVYDSTVATVPESDWDDEEGYLIINSDTTLADGRFIVKKVLGQGTFGKVVEAYDTRTKSICAVKIIRAVPKYRNASKIELRVLSTLSTYDRDNRNRCIHLRECFDYRNHICIVTDLLGMSVYDFLKSNQYLSFPASHVQSFARQLLSSVAYLHALNLVHTDLKPENILLRDNSSFTSKMPFHEKHETRQVLNDTRIHLIDFGSAVFDDEFHNSVVSTRHYRAPEIILGIGWSFPCDIWSIGCILVEVCTGEALFHTHDNLEHLALMQRVIGKPVDRALLRKASLNDVGAELLNSAGKLNYPNSTTKKASEKHVRATRTLSHIIKSVIPYIDADKTYWKLFLDLLGKIFVYDPRKRISAQEALMHPWLTTNVNDVDKN